MRKSLSIIFILLMFMNVMGYYWILTGLHYKSKQSFESLLNEDNYSESETVAFKFHLAIPYTDNKDFERAEGQFEYNGEYYHLVKQQYANDTLTLICVKNHASKRLSLALRDYVKTFADQPGNEGKSLKDFSNFLKDYLLQDFTINSSSAGWTKAVPFYTQQSGKPASFHTKITQPPELA